LEQQGGTLEADKTEEAEKKVEPLENIKTEKDKKEWVYKELKMFITNDAQKKKFNQLKNYEMIYYEFFELLIYMSNHFLKDKKTSSAKKLKTFIEETILPKFIIANETRYDPVIGIQYLETNKDRILMEYQAEQRKQQHELTKMN